MNKRPHRARAYDPDPDAPGGEPCAMHGCPQEGLYRAPRSRENLRDYMWLCLDHVRAYNAAWDFYKGMSPAQIEVHLRADTHWQRPSWKLGHLGGPAINPEIFGETLESLAGKRHKTAASGPAKIPENLRAPLAELGLSWPVTLSAVKTRYKELAKIHHPDANGGAKLSEERIKNINLAYATLRACLPPEHAMAAP